MALAVCAVCAHDPRAAERAPAAATVEVDASEAPRGILKAHLTLPVSAGPLTLVYPKWIPGRHSPVGPITSVAGPVLTAGGKRIAWRRDDVDLYAFHLEVPSGISTLDAYLELLTAPAPDGIVQGLETPRTATESLAIVEWNQLLLYPEGARSDDLTYRASIRLPDGWLLATALTNGAAASVSAAGTTSFEPTSLTTLVDSTVLAGKYFRIVELGGTPPVQLAIAADQPAALGMSTEMLGHYRSLVAEATTLFGATHYRHYQFQWALTEQIMPDGIEHHESSDDRSPLRALLDDDPRRAEASLLPHEYTHSWNGKFRRPAGLATPDYQAPMRDELLWVYEGLTEYLGDVLAARSGLLTVAEFRDELARIAAQLEVHKGRNWRSLEDAAIAAPLLYYQDWNWASRLRRQDDFYWEPALLWLEADTLIRAHSRGKRSLDDFCRRFYGGESGAPRVLPYDFDAVVDALTSVQPYDWRAFWRERLTRIGEVPLEGLAGGGWRLEFVAAENSMHRAHEVEDHELNLQYSLGLRIALDGGTFSDIVPGSPADAAGAAPGSHLVAVNGHKWSREVLHDALIEAAGGSHTVTLLVEKDGELRALALRYAGGERYPVLVRAAGADLLAQIVRPRDGGRSSRKL
ncbi:MAG: M61 family peptidase [Gammaproteobacteria bacterium]|nr:M61 family peptidase [Gammaproteobacteria bacterium]